MPLLKSLPPIRSFGFYSARRFTTSSRLDMKIIPVPVRSDNYAYLIIDQRTNKAAFVDPYDLSKVRQTAQQYGIKDDDVVGCLTTHHHNDHSGGNQDFAKTYPSLKIYGGSTQIPKLTDQVTHSDSFDLFPSIKVTCLSTPCHTLDSICYFVQDESDGSKAIFTGDTLFISGCGRFFEGSPQLMIQALNILKTLPDDTKIYCGHEYTKSNLTFSLGILNGPDEFEIQQLVKDVKNRRNDGVTMGIYTIQQEKKHNPFMRCDDPKVQQRVDGKDEIETMSILRDWKNRNKIQVNL